MSERTPQQLACHYELCGKIFWRHKGCRAGARRFCSPACREAYLRQVEIDAADARVRALNASYGEGALCGLFSSDIVRANDPCTNQLYHGILDGRRLRALRDTDTCGPAQRYLPANHADAGGQSGPASNHEPSREPARAACHPANPRRAP